MPPTISVIIPVYNAEKFIEKTLESIFNQSFTDFEIIVIDDGSTDNTPDILKPYRNKITCIRQENSGGPSSPRNRGINIAKGKYIALFDSDDLMFEGKLQRQVTILDENPEVSLVFSNFITLREDEPQQHSMFETEPVKEIINSIPQKKIGGNAYRFEKPIYDEILQNNFIGTSTVVFRKKDILEIGLFDTSLIGIEDRDMWLRFGKAGKIFAYTTDVLSYYRYIENSLSRQTKNLVSQIDFYHRLLRNDLNGRNYKIIKNRIGHLCLSYGYILRNRRVFLPAIFQNVKSLFYLKTDRKYEALLAISKIIIFRVSPRLSGSLSKK